MIDPLNQLRHSDKTMKFAVDERMRRAPGAITGATINYRESTPQSEAKQT
jgi:hypothetical protein